MVVSQIVKIALKVFRVLISIMSILMLKIKRKQLSKCLCLFLYLTQRIHGKNNLMNFCEKTFLGTCGSVVLQQQWENMLQEVSVLFTLFSKHINLCGG